MSATIRTVPRRSLPIPVIDLFAGPGGLGEGFAAYQESGAYRFRIALSIEKDAAAWETLRLRAFFRHLTMAPDGSGMPAPSDYYRFVRGEISLAELFGRHPKAAEAAQREAWNVELGAPDPGHEAVRRRITEALAARCHCWVLIGGPPCQPFSLAGRSRNRGKVGYRLETDPRHELYREYLRVIADHWPPVFVMENVKGLLSARVNGTSLFARVIEDLSDPRRALSMGKRGHKYRLFSVSRHGQLLADFSSIDPRHYLVLAEEYGIPQARHRVILLGVRDDLREVPDLLPSGQPVHTVADAIDGLPRLRSGLSRGMDTSDAWKSWLRAQRKSDWFRRLKDSGGRDVAEAISTALDRLKQHPADRGLEFVPCEPWVNFAQTWFIDPRLDGVANHASREHMPEDLSRYLFAACFAQVRGRSPTLSDFPRELLPKHASAKVARKNGGYFADRFRVQVRNRPATTVVSHIAKDGHYYIHYDPTQCRSLTVREAARLQTFPDNYIFLGNRTSQYIQVGNAVPPLLAREIAAVVFRLFRKAGWVR